MRRGNDAGSAHCYTPPMQPGGSVAVPYDASRRHLNQGESASGVLPIPSSPRNTEPRSSRHLQHIEAPGRRGSPRSCQRWRQHSKGVTVLRT